MKTSRSTRTFWCRSVSSFSESGCQVATRLSFPSKQSSRFVAAAACVAPLFLLATLAHGQATDFGSQAVGSVSSATTVTVSLTGSATLGSVSVLTQGASGLDFSDAGAGSCATGTGYNSGDSCTVNVSFKPQFPGSRYGAVVLKDGSGNVIGNTYLVGTGLGPQTTFMPGTETVVPTSVLNYPEGVAVDSTGALYIADANNDRLLKETLVSGSYVESVVPTTPGTWPYWVAVDGAGNVYTGATGTNQVLKETLTGVGTYTESVVPSSSLNGPYIVAVDASGNVYIADYFNNRILKETLSGTTYTETTITPNVTLNSAGSVAVDGAGNVYITDDHGYLLKETPASGSYTETVITSSGFSYPGGITVDALGDVYIADTGNMRIVKETPVAGSYVQSIVPTRTLHYPSGAAADGAGNVYVVDTNDFTVLKEDFADAPTLAFASTNQGSTSTDSPRAVTVSNGGNSGLNFSGISYPSDFPENSSATGDCSTSTVLTPATSCTLSINFSPVSLLNGSNSALLSEGVTVTTNTLNVPATVQTVLATGTETQP